MRRFWTLGILLAMLAGCGVDGKPIPPQPRETDVTVSGTLETGLTGQF